MLSQDDTPRKSLGPLPGTEEVSNIWEQLLSSKSA